MTKQFTFANRKGLWISQMFTDKFGSKPVTPTKSIPSFKVLHRSWSDAEIKKEIGVQECTLSDVAAFLMNPPKGTNDSYWNIFYVAGCVVGVGWDSDSRKWSVDAWKLGGVRWSAGRRVFSRNWHFDTQPSDSDTLTLSALAARVEALETFEKQVRAFLILP